MGRMSLLAKRFRSIQVEWHGDPPAAQHNYLIKSGMTQALAAAEAGRREGELLEVVDRGDGVYENQRGWWRMEEW